MGHTLVAQRMYVCMYLVYGRGTGVSARVNDVHTSGDKGWEDETVPLLGGITEAA